MAIIESQDLNDRFQKPIDGLSTQNKVPSGTKNIIFNFDMVPLTAGSLYDQNMDSENFTKVFRIYDDVQVIGIMADVLGYGRPQLSASNDPWPPLAGVPLVSKAVSFRVKILGNFTGLDDELGYPSIYKSTEFNLVNDFLVSFGDDASFTPHATQAIDLWEFGPNYLSNEEYIGSDLAPKRMPSRQIFYPLNPEGGTQILQGGSEYVLTLDPNGNNGKISQDDQQMPAYHLTTSVQISLVCRCFRRRFG
jgi:hypothetical protein